MILFQTDPYDPSEVEDQPKSSHLSSREIRYLGLVLVVILLALIPVYKFLKRGRDKHVCAGNFGAIYKAISLYAEDNDDRFPPVYAGFPNEPYVNREERVYTWASLIDQYLGSSRPNFVCPAADPSEIVHAQRIKEESVTDAQGKKVSTGDLPMTYGMYAPYNGCPRNLVAAPDQTFLLSETSTNGSMSSYDPFPLYPYDGFVIGADNDPIYPNSKTSTVSRLAYRQTSKGDFGPSAVPRHDKGIHFLTASGRLLTLPAPAAHVNIVGGIPTGHWAEPPVRY